MTVSLKRPLIVFCHLLKPWQKCWILIRTVCHVKNQPKSYQPDKIKCVILQGSSSIDAGYRSEGGAHYEALCNGVVSGCGSLRKPSVRCESPPGVEIFGYAPQYNTQHFSHIFTHKAEYQVPGKKSPLSYFFSFKKPSWDFSIPGFYQPHIEICLWSKTSINLVSGIILQSLSRF